MLLIKKSSIITILLLFFLGVAVAAEPIDLLIKDLDTLEKTSDATRRMYTELADSFYKIYSANTVGKSADMALYYTAKSYKNAYQKFNFIEDRENSLKYFRITSANFKSRYGAEAYLETAELYVAKRDLASAKFVLEKISTIYPGSVHETAAKSMIKDLESMNKNGTTAKSDSAEKSYTDNISKGFNSFTESTNPTPTPVKATTDVSDIIDISKIVNSAAPVNIPAGNALIKDIRFYSDNDYTRVVIDLNKNVKYEQHWLKADPSIKKPPRLFLDIYDTTVDTNISKELPIKDGLLKAVRWGYFRPGVARVVLDSESVNEFTVFQLAEPARIVIDVSREVSTNVAKSTVNDPKVTGTKPKPGTQGNTPANSGQTLAKVFGLKIKRIVIDPGHGGKDPGAINGTYKEKDMVLDIALQLRDYLKQNKDLEVFLTRDRDIFIPLEERTAIANRYKADLFISIHVNASKNKAAKGIETYVLNVTNDAKALEVAALENQATTKSLSDLQGILKDIMLNSKLEESLLLASSSQKLLVSGLGLSRVYDLGVKQAPFYVLVGAKMPSILVEAGFISNADELKNLKTPAYRKRVAKGVADGINEYIDKYNK